MLLVCYFFKFRDLRNLEFPGLSHIAVRALFLKFKSYLFSLIRKFRLSDSWIRSRLLSEMSESFILCLSYAPLGAGLAAPGVPSCPCCPPSLRSSTKSLFSLASSTYSFSLFFIMNVVKICLCYFCDNLSCQIQ